MKSRTNNVKWKMRNTTRLKEEERERLKLENAELSQNLEQEWEHYQKENKNQKLEHAELLQKLLEDRE